MSPPGSLALVPRASDESPGPFDLLNEDGTTTRVTTLEQAAALFGAGSAMYGIARRQLEGPRVYAPPSPEQVATIDRARVAYAFQVLGVYVELVEAHALALFEVDGTAAFTPNEWRAIAFHHLALMFERTPELLPFQVGAVDDDGGDW